MCLEPSSVDTIMASEQLGCRRQWQARPASAWPLGSRAALRAPAARGADAAAAWPLEERGKLAHSAAISHHSRYVCSLWGLEPRSPRLESALLKRS